MNMKLDSFNGLDVLNKENSTFKSDDHLLTTWNENIYFLMTAFEETICN